MNYLNCFFHLLFILFINELKCQNYGTIELNETLVLTYPNTSSEKILFGKMKFYKGKIFYNFPRIKNNAEQYDNKSTFLSLEGDNYKAWPNEEMNKKEESTNCSRFISIIDFDFDYEGSIYLLDEGEPDTCSTKIYKYNIKEKKQLQSIKVLLIEQPNILVLNGFVIDTINNYTYIAYYIKNESSNNVGIIAKSLENENSEYYKRELKDTKYKIDKKYNFSQNVSVNIEAMKINIALSCDGEYLFFSPLASRMIYSIKTESFITKSENIYINEAYKNESTSALVVSSLGNLYFAGIENKKIYIQYQVYNDLSIFNFKGFVSRENDSMNWVTSLSIDDGFLYINSVKEVKEIKIDNNSNINVTLEIYSAKFDNEKSYVYKCSGLGFKWTLNAIFIWIIFLIVVCIICTFVYYGNKQDEEIKRLKKYK